jgi:TldD protein
VNTLTTSSDDAVDTVVSRMLEPAGLRRGHLNDALGSINRRDVDAADLYFQISRQESWSMEDGRIKEGSFNLDQGVGVRAVCGEKTGFAYSDEILLPALIEAAGAARAISRQGQSREVRVHTGRPPILRALSKPSGLRSNRYGISTGQGDSLSDDRW